MKKKVKFYYCPYCQNLIEMVEDSGMVPVCCNHEMKLLEPKESDTGTEKHVPTLLYDHSYHKDHLVVQVGEQMHPQTAEHHISFVYIVTNQRKTKFDLRTSSLPVIRFLLEEGELVEEVYAYCNIHGLWVNKH